MFSLLKKKKQEINDNPNSQPLVLSKEPEKEHKNGEIDYSKLLSDTEELEKKPEKPKQETEKPSKTSNTDVSTPEPITATNTTPSIDTTEIKEALSGIYLLLERQNKILENIAGFQTQTHKNTELDDIDHNIIKLFEHKTEIDARTLQTKVLEKKICSVSTLFLHLKKLVALGIIKKMRKKQFMVYHLLNNDNPED